MNSSLATRLIHDGSCRIRRSKSKNKIFFDENNPDASFSYLTSPQALSFHPTPVIGTEDTTWLRNVKYHLLITLQQEQKTQTVVNATQSDSGKIDQAGLLRQDRFGVPTEEQAPRNALRHGQPSVHHLFQNSPEEALKLPKSSVET